MLLLPRFLARLYAPCGCWFERPVLLMLVFTLLMLAPLYNWNAVQPLPPVAAKITRLNDLQVEQAHGSAQTTPPAATTSSYRAFFRLPTAVPTARGRARHLTFFSQALGRNLDYWIYLPPSYATGARRYSVLYVLHGRGGSSSEWKDLGLFDEADALIRRQQIASMIIVSPQGDLGYWMNHAGGGPRWGDYIIQDLIPHIDATYRTLAERSHRAIGGISMGGHGAMQLALHHPDLFGAVGGHSAVFRTEAESFPFFGTGADYQQRDPVSLVRDLHMPVPFALWLDMGTDDFWMQRTLAFHEILLERGIEHSWRLDPGGHEGGYWSSHLRAYLEWYNKTLR